MALESKVLGYPGQDNALFLGIDTGQTIYRLLLDCGDVNLFQLGKSTLQDMDHLFISHAHMDHICGFDSLFRNLYSRPRPFHIWGPKGIIAIMHCRFRSFTWNLVERKGGEMIVHEVLEEEVLSSKFLCSEGFAKIHPLNESKRSNQILFQNEDFIVECVILDHKTECLAFKISEKDKEKISLEKLQKEGFLAGPWCSEVKRQDLPENHPISIRDKTYSLKVLKEKLLETKKGRGFAYVTDIIMHESNRNKVLSLIQECDELIIESTYLDADEELATRNFHLTASQAAALAKEGKIKKMILFHISDRYTREERLQMLSQVKQKVPEAYFPEHWR